MRDLFIVEPMGDPRILGHLLGEDPANANPRAAILPGHVIGASGDGLRIAASREAGEDARGYVLSPSTEGRERLAFWMAAIGAKALVAGVLEGEAKSVVDTFVLPRAAVPRRWQPEDWDGEWADLVREAAEEIGRLYGPREPRDLPALLPGVGFRALSRARGAREAAPVGLRAGLGRDDVRELELEPAYTNYFAVEEHVLKFRRFDGEWSAPVERAAFASGDAATVLPFDAVAGTVLLIEQFRTGPNARRDPRPWCLETVAGRCDPMETVEQTIRREAREEAGLTLGRVERIAGYYSSPAATTEYITSFVGQADLSGGGGHHGLESEDEDIRGMVVPLDQAMAAVRSGEVNNAPLLVSLLWLERHAARLRREWEGAGAAG